MRRVDNFIEQRVFIEANYSDPGLQVDIPIGYEYETIVIELRGIFKVEGVTLLLPKEQRQYQLVPPVILRTRPLEYPAYIVIPFLDTLDLRAYQTGDVKLGFSISGFRYPGLPFSPVPEELVINYHKVD